MIRFLGLGLLTLLVSMPAAGASQSAAPVPASEPAKILVTFSDPAMNSSSRVSTSGPGYKRGSSTYLVSIGVKRTASRIARDLELEVVEEWPILSLRVHCLVYAVPETADTDDVLSRLRQLPEVESAQTLNEFQVSSRDPSPAGESYENLQHSLESLELVKAHQWSRGARTRISIIDTGVDTDHPELKAQISSLHDFVDQEIQEQPANVHGTAVAGVIGANADNGVGIIGVAPSARLEILRACWNMPNRPSAVCNSFTLARALDHAIGSRTDIINLSLTGPSDELLARLVNQALNDGIVVIAAAPEDPHSGFPAEIEGVITVGSSPESRLEQAMQTSQIRAPGTDILVPTPRGGFDYASGTSLAAAHVSGVVALLIASRPRLTGHEVRALLLNSQAENRGTVNACRALSELLSESGCRTDMLVENSQ